MNSQRKDLSFTHIRTIWQSRVNFLAGWMLVGCIEDECCFSGISAVSRLGSRRHPISENSSGEARNRSTYLLLRKTKA